MVIGSQDLLVEKDVFMLELKIQQSVSKLGVQVSLLFKS